MTEEHEEFLTQREKELRGAAKFLLRQLMQKSIEPEVWFSAMTALEREMNNLIPLWGGWSFSSLMES